MKVIKILGGCVVLSLLFLLILRLLPAPVFTEPPSRVIFDRNGRLLSAHVAKDGQWRFPPISAVPPRFEDCILLKEDKRFHSHPGLDPWAMSRAIIQNLFAGRIVSGASTISMQLARLYRKGPRTWSEKAQEAILTLRFELHYSKAEILAMYASYAPFGGNVVGLHAASWRYFSVSPDHLSWAQAATLACLPKAPGLIHPGRNKELLLSKRNHLLAQLHHKGTIDSISYRAAIVEPIPSKPMPLPNLAPHAMHYLCRKGIASGQSTLDADLQQQFTFIMERHKNRLSKMKIHNSALIVADTKSGEVLCYIGNFPEQSETHHSWVDVAQAPRSTGSILKPFLYAHMIEEGQLLPSQWIPDIPMGISGYYPKNFVDQHEGLVAADEALQHSLNIPFVYLTDKYDYTRFYDKLQSWNFRSIHKGGDHYGLSLILGGAESTLWEITNAYRQLGYISTYYQTHSSRYPMPESIRLIKDRTTQEELIQPPILSAGAASLTLAVLEQLKRPNQYSSWELISDIGEFSWKTGTSIGFRDAWAVGVNPDYTVGVWCGNADGEGRDGLVGYTAAAPILFDIVRSLPFSNGFSLAYDDIKQASICKVTGFPPSAYCPRDSIWIPNLAKSYVPPCPYHKKVLIDEQGQRRYRHCITPLTRIDTALQFSPEEWYYLSRRKPHIQNCPKLALACESFSHPMSWIVPTFSKRIIVQHNELNKPSPILFELSHDDSHSIVYWHVNGTYIGQTKGSHVQAITPQGDKLKVSAVDQAGNQLSAAFDLIY